MPGTFEAALVFAYAIVPGFLALTGYQSGRSQKRAVPERDLHVIAEAFVLSLGWIMLPPIALAAIELASWVSGEPVDTSAWRILAAFALAATVFFVPLAVGYGAARFERAARDDRGGSAGRWFRRLVPQRTTAWDMMWMPVLRAKNGRALVRIEFDDDRDGLVGQFADSSQVDLSPDPPQVFLESTLVAVDDGGSTRIEVGPGMHVDGAKIRYITVEPLS